MQKKLLSSMLWRFAERSGAQIVSFFVSILLARLLNPEDYGIIVIVTVIISILNLLVDSGFGNALIQKKNVDDIDFSSVFYFNIVLCILIYILLFVSAPLIASFYSIEELILIIRVLAITVIISGVRNIQQAYVTRKLLFKKFFFSTLLGTTGAAAIGILMALEGFGVWALVAQQVFNITIGTLVLWFTVKWRPKKVFSLIRLKQLFIYGWKLLVSSLLNKGYSDAWQLIIGKIYSYDDLAFYNRGNQLPLLVVNNINASIDSVLFPTMSKMQEDIAAVKVITKRAIKISSYIMWPLMMGLGVVSEPLIRLLLTEKWIYCVPYLRIFCLTYALWPIHTANLNAIKALGRSDMFLKMEILKIFVGIIALLLVFRMGVIIMALSVLATSIISGIINAYPNKKLLNYSFLEQIKDITPNMLIALIMATLIYPFSFFKLPDNIILPLQVICGGIIYIMLSIVFKIESFIYVKSLWSTFFKSIRINNKG